MPILWRYALQSYLRVFLLSVSTFIGVLLLSRFKDIARFTALTGDFGNTALFTVYQIPSILPIAIPISALITSLLLFQRLSRTFELTAFRAAGLSLKTLLTPLLLASFLLSLFNFSLQAEITPYCRRESKRLIFEQTTENPLVLLQRKQLVNLKNAYVDMDVQSENNVKDFLFISCNEQSNRLNLISARKLEIKEAELLGENFAIVSYIPGSSNTDTLVIENQAEMKTNAYLLSSLLKKNYAGLDLNAQSFKMLRLQPKLSASRIEMLRRISLSLAVFSFTLLGCAFGIEEGRNPSKKNLFFAIALMLTVLLSYLLGKSLKDFSLPAQIAFLLPHPFIWICSSFHLYRISKGRL